MIKKRNLWIMFFLQICTLGFYGYYAFYKTLQTFYNLDNDKKPMFKRRSLIWILIFVIKICMGIIGVIVSIMLFGALGLFSFLILGPILQIIIILLLVKEFSLITNISNSYGIPTGENYKYLMAVITSGAPILSALVFQVRLDTIEGTGKYGKIYYNEDANVRENTSINTSSNNINNEFDKYTTPINEDFFKSEEIDNVNNVEKIQNIETMSEYNDENIGDVKNVVEEDINKGEESIDENKIVDNNSNSVYEISGVDEINDKDVYDL